MSPFLDGWIAHRCGLDAATPQSVLRVQLARFNAVLRHVRRNGVFYRKRLAGLFERRGDLIETGMWPREPFDVAEIPLTEAADIKRDGGRFLCVPLDEIARIVTLSTSGTTGIPKRLAFAADDLESTLDFFAHGISVLVRAGDSVLILLPGAERPDGVADLLRRALPRIGARGIPGDPAADPKLFRKEVERYRPQCLVAAPSQLRRLLEGLESPPNLRAVLSSAEPLPDDVRGALAARWGCAVFDHYGLTETGYGGGGECPSHDGYHLREADLYWEVIDPFSGEPVPDGTPGEVVFTTLTRRAMPLIRYRTGDLASMLPGPCACGSPLRRLSRIRGRLARGKDGTLTVIAPSKGWMGP
ncbi:DVU_1553 family AMP-dependent CoA ligase [uncultured Bilophila sp.]|uniref:DVU_1553 family AMP-dependent CoA ligase n=1 Tax=uncultured Bilophila sp. TaxID=529385 RepID=UPI0026287BC8|nr:AMP-binding protein [uncultured Bilophila sp.]